MPYIEEPANASSATPARRTSEGPPFTSFRALRQQISARVQAACQEINAAAAADEMAIAAATGAATGAARETAIRSVPLYTYTARAPETLHVLHR